MSQQVSGFLLENITGPLDGASASSLLLEVVTADVAGSQVRGVLYELVTAPDPDASQVRGFLMEVVTAPRRAGLGDPIQGGGGLRAGLQGTYAIQGTNIQGGGSLKR